MVKPNMGMLQRIDMSHKEYNLKVPRKIPKLLKVSAILKNGHEEILC